MKARLAALTVIALALVLGQAESYVQADSTHEENLNSLINDYLKSTESRLSSMISRDKKAHPNSPEEQPLLHHSRKTFLDTSSTCQSGNMVAETNIMIDSKTSLDRGAKFFGVEKIGWGSSGKTSLKELHESCSRACCESESECDTALLSLKIGEEGYRCYLFRCDERCIFIRHDDYVVLRAPSPEEQPFIEGGSDSKSSITTGQNQNKNLCNMKFEFKCRSGKPECIPIYDVCDSIPHCSDKSDETNCTGSDLTSSSTKLAKASETDLLDDANGSTDYDDYTLKLLKQQKSIMSHLKELEEAKAWDKNSVDAKNGQDQPVFKTPEGYLDSFLKPGPSGAKNAWKSTTRSSSTTARKQKVVFHDDVLSESAMFGPDSGNRIVFSDDEAKWPVSGTTMAIMLLILSCALVISFFAYVTLSTRFMSKRIKWVGSKLPGQKNVDVDGDYLINGMYL